MKKETKKVTAKAAKKATPAKAAKKPAVVKEVKKLRQIDPILAEINDLNAKGRMALLNERILLVQKKSTAQAVKQKLMIAKDYQERLTELKEQGLVQSDFTAEEYALLNGALPITEDIYTTGILAEYDAKLRALRENGEYEVGRLTDAIKTLSLKRSIDKNEKKERIASLKEELASAKQIEKENAAEVRLLKREATAIAKLYGVEVKRYAKFVCEFNIRIAKNVRRAKLKEEETRYSTHLAETNAENRKFVKLQHKSNVSDIEREYTETYVRSKDAAYASYLAKYNYYRITRNNKLTAGQNLEFHNRSYAHNFSFGSWLLKNALYIVIIAFFIACAIICITVKNDNILTFDSLLIILGTAAPKLFFALGVAGLILLGGTDLSVGRMTGLAASLSCLFLSLPGSTYDTIFGTLTIPSLPIPVALILAIVVSVAATVLFSALAGFFTAKFKMHPFITTLSTQLIIFGVLMVCFGRVSNFVMQNDVANAIAGPKSWRLIIYATIAVIIVWFIWNKTKFGRHMYAVGDNQEAAKVSGINVFAVVMGVFVLAGVCYGLGGFFQGANLTYANPTVGAGTELDAIAACVIGGVSFSGGRGKVSGVVIGTIIFSTLTFCLGRLGLDVNFQFIFKGIIILAAVCLDSLKLVKKK